MRFCGIELGARVIAKQDTSIGLWLTSLNITRKHDIRFDTEWKVSVLYKCDLTLQKSRGCQNNHLVSHKQTPEDMFKKHLKVR